MERGGRGQATDSHAVCASPEGALQRGLNTHAVEHLSQLWRSIREAPSGSTRWAPTDSIERFGGADRTRFEDFVREHRADFLAPSA